MKKPLYFLIVILSFIACKPGPEQKSADALDDDPSTGQSIRKIDVHSHYRYGRAYLPDLFRKWNMQSVLVDVAKEDSTGINRSWKEYLVLEHTYPDLFFLCSSLIGAGIDAPDFAQQKIAQLGRELDSGAIMVKVWKNFGMVTKDASGAFIQIDDPRLQPVWDFLKKKGIPVMAHIGEPEQAWRPLDPDSPHYGYYKNHPEYYAYLHPEIPSYETIITARDHWIEMNPDLNILCAHLGSMSHNVDMVAERLDKFPNIQVELAARFGDLARQESGKVRAFFKKYQDRILFGTDFGTDTPEASMTAEGLEDEHMDLDASYENLWNYLSGTDSVTVRGKKTAGLGLPPEVLNKVFYQNAANFLKLE